jgi:anti-sigma regulatory factor (Ser/Thr protein kinase)
MASRRGRQMSSPAIPAGEPFVHTGMFYRGLPDYLAGTLAFIEEGLADGHPVAVAVPGAKLEPLRAELADAAARVRLIDMNHAGRNPGRILPGVLLAFADEHRHAARVRIIGEPIWSGRSEVEYPACVQHEGLINHAFAGRSVEILCPYDAEALSAAVLADVELTHPTLTDGAGRRSSPAYAPDRAHAAYNQPFPEPPQPSAALPVDRRGLWDARQVAVAEAHRAGLMRDRVDDFELAVNELLTNSIEHGGGHGALRVWLDDGHLVAEVRDSGHLDDPMVGRRPPAPGQPRGRGLFLVNHLADLVRIYSGSWGTAIRIFMTHGASTSSSGNAAVESCRG